MQIQNGLQMILLIVMILTVFNDFNERYYMYDMHSIINNTYYRYHIIYFIYIAIIIMYLYGKVLENIHIFIKKQLTDSFFYINIVCIIYIHIKINVIFYNLMQSNSCNNIYYWLI